MSAPLIDFPVISTYQDFVNLTGEIGASERMHEAYQLFGQIIQGAKDDLDLPPEQLELVEKIDHLVQKKIFPLIKVAEEVEKKIADGKVTLIEDLTEDEAGVIFIALQALEEVMRMFENFSQ